MVYEARNLITPAAFAELLVEMQNMYSAGLLEGRSPLDRIKARVGNRTPRDQESIQG